MATDGTFSNEPIREEYKQTVVEQPRSVWTPILGAGIVALAAFSFYENSQIGGLREELASRQAETATIQQQVAALNNTLTGATSDMQAKLASTEQQTTESIARAAQLASKHADAVVGKATKTLEQKNAERQAAVDAELAGVKNAASDAATQINTRFEGVGASVETVKADLQSTRAVADKTASELQRANGDMGVMSGLIATNGREIQELKAMGDRNIYEFNINKKAGLQKVGDVQIRVTKTDDKHNRYTMVVMADDKLVEKKDKTTNEPVQFYAAMGMRTPYEVVVNQVSKDSIKGYLATPKLNTARK